VLVALEVRSMLRAAQGWAGEDDRAALEGQAWALGRDPSLRWGLAP
jgi:hypothetical protein